MGAGSLCRGGMARRVARVAALLAALGIRGGAGAAAAHPARASAVLLDVKASEIEVEMQVPDDQLAMALGEGDSFDEGYLRAHFGAVAPDGRAYAMRIAGSEVAAIDGAEHVVVKVVLAAPEGASTERFTLRDDVVLHRVASHEVFVTLRSDDGAALARGPEALGVMRLERETLAVSRPRGARWGLLAAAGGVVVLVVAGALAAVTRRQGFGFASSASM